MRFNSEGIFIVYFTISAVQCIPYLERANTAYVASVIYDQIPYDVLLCDDILKIRSYKIWVLKFVIRYD